MFDIFVVICISLHSRDRVVGPSLVDMVPGILDSTGDVDWLNARDVGLDVPVQEYRSVYSCQN